MKMTKKRKTKRKTKRKMKMRKTKKRMDTTKRTRMNRRTPNHYVVGRGKRGQFD
jgi:hypothetical protein